jgi:hypothetical protein
MAKLNTNMTLIRAEAELRRQFEEALTYAIQYDGPTWNDVERLQRQLNLYRTALNMEPAVLQWRPRVLQEEREELAA